jgi:BirA family biotin operon repressor/biotin-[acetyl-CoA-carboxylase] ligase
MAKPPPIIAFEEIDSTNQEARRRIEAGDTSSVWITAGRQTAGRGRRGRSWETVDGNLAATLLLTTLKPPLEAAQIAFVAALAVSDLIGAYLPSSLVSLKWPNDTLISGRKVSGVLVESGSLGVDRIWLAVGMGVNLAQAPQNAERPATALSEHLRRPPPAPLDALNQLAEAMEHWRSLWELSGFRPIAQAWSERAHGLGEPCVARLPTESVQGVAEGLDSDGALRLRLADGRIRRITAGDVFF